MGTILGMLFGLGVIGGLPKLGFPGFGLPGLPDIDLPDIDIPGINGGIGDLDVAPVTIGGV